MEFLKELFGEQPITYEEFEKAVSKKGYQLADVSTGYVTQQEYDAKAQALDVAALGNQTMQKEHAIDLELMKAKGRNLKAIKALIDMDNVTLTEDGALSGLDLEGLQKESPYLFDTEQRSVSGTGEGGRGRAAEGIDNASAFEAAVFGRQ